MLSLGWLLVFCIPLIDAASPRPHIIFILADDLGWNDVSFHGSSQIPTPNLDALASSGIILNNYYVAPICSPSRSALMTGRHPIHTGMYHDVIYAAQPYGLSLTEKLLPQYLKELGYATHMVGKWHLGFFKKEYTPTYRGFDSHCGYYTGEQDYYDHTGLDSNSLWGYDFHKNGSIYKDAFGKYSTHVFTDEAVNIITNHDVNQPLFLYFAHQATHSANYYNPLQAPPEYIDKFPNILDEKRRKFAGMVEGIDESIKQIVLTLYGKGMLDNTIIAFSTDNGGPANGFNYNMASNWPLRGTKDSLWEGGVRGNGIIWASSFQQQSRVSDQLMDITDWLPTLLHAAGYSVDSLSDLDGVDMWDALSNNLTSPRTEVLHNIDDQRGIAALRIGDYKVVIGVTYEGEYNGWLPPPQVDESFKNSNLLPKSKLSEIFKRIHKKKGLSEPNFDIQKSAQVTCGPIPANASTSCLPKKKPCLFNIVEDPCEFNNIADSYPDLLQQLLDRLAAYNATVVPPRNKPTDPMGNPIYHDNMWVPWVKS